MAYILASVASTKRRTGFVVMVSGRFFQRGDENPDNPKELEEWQTLDAATQQADYWLGCWSTSHTTIEQPEIWVEDQDFKRVYEPWLARRRVRNQDGRVLIETPVQFWQKALDEWRAACRADPRPDAMEPMPFGHMMFEQPDVYRMELLAPVLNRAMFPYDSSQSEMA